LQQKRHAGLHIANEIGKNTPDCIQFKNHILHTLLQANMTALNFDADSGSRLRRRAVNRDAMLAPQV
jgi:hypothetical protein